MYENIFNLRQMQCQTLDLERATCRAAFSVVSFSQTKNGFQRLRYLPGEGAGNGEIYVVIFQSLVILLTRVYIRGWNQALPSCDS